MFAEITGNLGEMGGCFRVLYGNYFFLMITKIVMPKETASRITMVKAKSPS